MSSVYELCTLCGRNCRINRHNTLGACGMPQDMYIARAALHMWEEPPISGTRGSGTVFFSGCSLGCIFCQNREISRRISGKRVSTDRLAEIMLELRAAGAHNINLVTPTHYAPSIKEAIILAKSKGLSIPIVYNTGSYDSVETLRHLEGLVDVYLPDFKYFQPKTARAYSKAPDYPDVARAAIAEMVRQTGAPSFTDDGIMRRGTIVRILLLPGHLAEAKLSLKYLYSTYGDSVYISLMSQYTPTEGMPPPLNRRVTSAEYGELVEYAERLGVTQCFVQERAAADQKYIPAFDESGV